MQKLAALLVLFFALPLFAELPPLIPRDVLFSNPAKDFPLISADGKKVAYLAPASSGVLNLWVQTIDGSQATQLSDDRSFGIYYFDWAGDSDHLFFFQDNNGDENYHLKMVDLRDRSVRDITPYPGIKAQNLLTDRKHPDEVLIGLNKRDPKVFDMYRLNLKSGDLTLETENPGDVLSWSVNPDFQIAAATAFRPSDLSTVIRVRDAKDQSWRDLVTMPFEKTAFPGQYNGGSLILGFSPDKKSLLLASALHSDMVQLVRVDAQTGKELEIIAEDPTSDIWLAPPEQNIFVVALNSKSEVDAVAFEYTKPFYKVVNPKVKTDFDFLARNESKTFRLVNRDVADSKWLIQYIQADAPDRYFIYDRPAKKLQFLFTNYPDVTRYKLSTVEPVTFEARDGLSLMGYLTLPSGVPAKNLPTVLFVHGGPWARIDYGYDPYSQWLANRGYAVFFLNFRGSTGLGMKLFNAGNGQWAGKMQDDLTDAVRWAIAKGIANPKRVVIMGNSYGGYATLSGITFTPDLYAAAVAGWGISDIDYFLHSFPDWWGPVKKRWIRRIGVDAENDPEGNKRISPLFHVDKIRAPLLIAHGSNDSRVKQNASDQIVAAMRKRNLPVTYLLYMDEGHGLYRPENTKDWLGRVEEFLSKQIGGRAEPWKAVPGSTVQMK